MADQYYHCIKCSKPQLGQRDYLIDGVELEFNNPKVSVLLYDENKPPKVVSRPPSKRFLKDKKTDDFICGRLLVCGHFITARQESLALIREETEKSLVLTDGSIIEDEEISELRKQVLSVLMNLSSETLIALNYFYSLVNSEGINEKELNQERHNVMQSILKMTPDQLIVHVQEHFNSYRNHLKASKKEKYTIQLIQDELERKSLSGTLSDSAKQDYAHLFRKSPRNAEKLVREKIKADNSAMQKEKATNSALEQMRQAMQAMGKNISLEELKERMKGKGKE